MTPKNNSMTLSRTLYGIAAVLLLACLVFLVGADFLMAKRTLVAGALFSLGGFAAVHRDHVRPWLRPRPAIVRTVQTPRSGVTREKRA